MTLSDVGELIKVLGAVATAAAAWFAALTAFKGLEKWRAETVGKQRVELATTVLRMVYEFAEILRAARDPWVMNHETRKQDGVPETVTQNSNYVPERRLLEHQEFFSRFRSLKHEYAAVFGRDAAKPFDELWKLRLDVNHAVDAMLTSAELGNSRDPDDIKLWKEWYRTAFRDPVEANDGMLKSIAVQIEAVEKTCRAAVESK
jgi:hypothetical protein